MTSVPPPSAPVANRANVEGTAQLDNTVDQLQRLLCQAMSDSSSDKEALRRATELLKAIAVEPQTGSGNPETDLQAKRASRLQLETLSIASAARNAVHAGSLLTNHFAQALDCDVVAFGHSMTGGDQSLQSVSGVAKLDRHSETARSYEAVMDEAAAAAAPIVFHRDAPDSTGGVACRCLCNELSVAVVIAVPIFDQQQQPLAVWVAAGDHSLTERLPLLTALSDLVKPALQRIAWQTKSTSVKGRCERIKRWCRTKPTITTVVATVALGLFVPWPYWMACDATLEPVTRRFIVAPYEGVLEQQLVDPGDVVAAGQVVARMDGRELRMRRSSLHAELSSEIKRRDAARAQGDHAEAQIAGWKVEGLRQDLQLLEHQAENLEIRAPIAGIVVAGDLDQVEGAPLEQGQTLYEVSPLDEMVVEAAVPEAEVRHLKVGAKAKIYFDAFPHRSWEAIVQRVHPRAEMRENESVFIAEVKLDNSQQLLRPGMNGRARLRGPVRPIVWNLFHRAWERMLAKTGW